MRILLTCSRSWTAWSIMRAALVQVHEKYQEAILVHGAAEKGDRQAAGMWLSFGGVDEPWPAKWSEHGDDCRCSRTTRSKPVCGFAGLRRNVAMVESAPDLCLAFINKASKGASHCAQIAEDAGIPVVRYHQVEP